MDYSDPVCLTVSIRLGEYFIVYFVWCGGRHFIQQNLTMQYSQVVQDFQGNLEFPLDLGPPLWETAVG